MHLHEGATYLILDPFGESSVAVQSQVVQPVN